MKTKYIVGFKYNRERNWHIVLETFRKTKADMKYNYLKENLRNEIEYNENKKGEVVKKINNYTILLKADYIKK